jgi:dCMP deaminase
MPRKRQRTIKKAKTKNSAAYKRPSWDDYFLYLIDVVGQRATCDRGRSGCVVVKDNRVVAAGYVGSPKGLDHCDEAGHDLRKTINEKGEISQHCVRTIHAEQNAICQAAKFGILLDGGTLYCKMTPCAVCAKMIINTGINRVVAQRRYRADQDTIKMFKKAKVKLKIKENKLEQYKNM